MALRVNDEAGAERVDHLGRGLVLHPKEVLEHPVLGGTGGEGGLLIVARLLADGRTDGHHRWADLLHQVGKARQGLCGRAANIDRCCMFDGHLGKRRRPLPANHAGHGCGGKQRGGEGGAAEAGVGVHHDRVLGCWRSLP